MKMMKALKPNIPNTGIATRLTVDKDVLVLGCLGKKNAN
jgi:hypothetical protein